MFYLIFNLNVNYLGQINDSGIIESIRKSSVCTFHSSGITGSQSSRRAHSEGEMPRKTWVTSSCPFGPR